MSAPLIFAMQQSRIEAFKILDCTLHIAHCTLRIDIDAIGFAASAAPTGVPEVVRHTLFNSMLIAMMSLEP